MEKLIAVREAAETKEKGSIRKLENYYDEYEFHFSPIRNKLLQHKQELNLLEIGVQGGGSLYMWKKYFPNVRITGVDIESICKQYESGNVSIEIGDQADPDFLNNMEKKHGPFNIIIDDGGHTMEQQITSFKTLFPLLKEGGIYVIEDIHTSYWPEFGGKKGKERTAISMVKDLIDSMHYWATRNPRASFVRRLQRKVFSAIKWSLPPVLPRNIFEEYVKSIHIADSIVFIYKGKLEKDKVRRI
jgi:hypothetical protein